LTILQYCLTLYLNRGELGLIFFLADHQLLPTAIFGDSLKEATMAEIKKILLATDFSENSKWALTYALSFAKKYDAKLYILHVIQQPTYPLGMYAEISFDAMDKFNRNISEATEKEMKNLCETELGGLKNYESMIVSGTPFLEILRTAKEKEVDLIIVGTHGRTGLDHVLFGSTAEKVVRKAPCPVLSVRLPGKEFKMP
jgi:nucleotide-binding universal stress UspA family protein